MNKHCYYHSHQLDHDVCSAKYILELAQHQVPLKPYRQINAKLPKNKRMSTQCLRKKYLSTTVCSKRTVKLADQKIDYTNVNNSKALASRLELRMRSGIDRHMQCINTIEDMWK